ncbi:hypothetical protein DXG01_016283, partial [Tephrocybe rancida]
LDDEEDGGEEDADYDTEQESLDLGFSSDKDEDDELASREAWGSGNKDFDEMYGNDDDMEQSR